MKIAVSGAHRTGKTTLIDRLSDQLPAFQVIDEPYHQLEEDGHVFADLPCVQDFELQLQRSVRSVADGHGDCLFDRSPADLLAYLVCCAEPGGFDLEGWLPEVREAMRQLDLVVYVPIEDPDRVGVSPADHRRLRTQVDEELYGIVFQDNWGFGVPVIEVTGTPAERARQVLSYLADKADVHVDDR